MFHFRCCFAHSVYEAGDLVLHGNVSSMGKRCALLSFQARINNTQHTNAKRDGAWRHGIRRSIRYQISAATHQPKLHMRPRGTDAAKAASDASPYAVRVADYAAPFIFIPAYIEPSFNISAFTCGTYCATWVQEIPTPYERWEVVRFLECSKP